MKPLSEIMKRGNEIVNNNEIEPAGYRLLILPLVADKFVGEGHDAPELEKLGFQIATDDQNARETKGIDYAVLMSIGKGAWKGKHIVDSGDWAQVGQVIRYVRYTGHEFEHPPGSGNRYRLINDEDVLGFYEENVNVG